jgi:hypothetical protein
LAGALAASVQRKYFLFSTGNPSGVPCIWALYALAVLLAKGKREHQAGVSSDLTGPFLQAKGPHPEQAPTQSSHTPHCAASSGLVFRTRTSRVLAWLPLHGACPENYAQWVASPHHSA